MDNPYLDRLIQHYRTMHGNKTVAKDDFVRGLLAAMKAGETVGILMDTNMTPPQGVFVNFFGISGVHGERTRAHRAAHGCGGVAGIHDLG